MPTPRVPRVAPLLWLVTWTGVLLAAAPPVRGAEAPATDVATADFSGDWDTTFGPMRLTQKGAAVKGTYGPADAPAAIQGEVVGPRFTFNYAEPNAVGEGWFELATDGQSFAGEWREKGDENWQDWRG